MQHRTASAFICLCLASIAVVQSQTQVASANQSGVSSTAQCVAQGLNGECNSCVCCCYNGTSGFINTLPSSDCTCKSSIKASDVKIGITLAVIVLVPTLLTSCYFNDLLWISPYRKIRQPMNSNLSPHSRAMELTCRTR